MTGQYIVNDIYVLFPAGGGEKYASKSIKSTENYVVYYKTLTF